MQQLNACLAPVTVISRRFGNLERGVKNSSTEPASISSCVTGFGRSGGCATTAQPSSSYRHRLGGEPVGATARPRAGVGDQLRGHVLELHRGDRAGHVLHRVVQLAGVPARDAAPSQVVQLAGSA